MSDENYPYARVIGMVCVAVVLVTACIVAGIVYATQQGTQRRETCVSAGGTWVASYCIAPDGSVTAQ